MTSLTKRDFERMEAELAGQPIPTNADYRRRTRREVYYWVGVLALFVLAAFVLKLIVTGWS